MINPIIPGFAPDPSIVRVDGWFFLVTSSFHLFPGLPVYASRDLASWKHIGNAIHRQSQLSLSKSLTKISWPGAATGGEAMLATAGLYAPTIRHHDGKFYVICTNAKRPNATETITENFVVSTSDIWKGEWSDPVYIDFNGIDPDIFIDDDGKTYFSGSAPPGPNNTINCFQFDIQTGKKLSEERIIWKGAGGVYPEGPHIYKRNGWYYLVIAEGGTHQTHMVTTARSRDIWGPYESYPHNPILTAHGTDEYIQHTGHCDAFQDEKGNWWAVCIGVRKEKAGRFVLGRETFLTPGSWDGDWLSLERVVSSPERLKEGGNSPFSSVPNVDYVYIRDPNADRYRINETGPVINLTPSPVDLSDPEKSPTFIGKRQRKLIGQSSVTLSNISAARLAKESRSGIACYKDELRYFRISFDARDSTIAFEMVNKAKKISRIIRSTVAIESNAISLCIKYTEQEYKLLYSTELEGSENWTLLAAFDTLDMTDLDFVGPVIGIFSVAENDVTDISFERFQVD